MSLVDAEFILARHDGESELEYKKRVLRERLIDRSIPDVPFSRVANIVFGHPYAEDNSRRMCYGAARFLQMMDEEPTAKHDRCLSGELDTTLDMQMVELAKQRQFLRDQRNALNKVMRGRSRQEELNEIVRDAIEHSDSLPVLSDYDGERFVFGDNDLIVSLNDIHYGASYDGYRGSYNSDICADMFNAYATKIEAIRETHKSRDCWVTGNGDFISGFIHRSIQISNRENVIEQIIGVSELIAQFLNRLAGSFRDVFFVSVAGNHSRLERKDDALQDERLDDLVGWYLAARLQNVSNVHFGEEVKVNPTMYYINVRGKCYVGVHGDYDSPTSIQTLQTMAGVPVYAVLMGHRHHNATDNVQGIRTIMGGSFLGNDDYAISKRLYGEPEQIVCVCDEDGVRCHYDVALHV